MKVYIFGNSLSPAVAIYGLRQIAKEAEAEFGADVVKFVERDFYVDDGHYRLGRLLLISSRGPKKPWHVPI